MPPDGVVKFQPIDIAKLLLWQLMRASDVYERNIKARAALTYEPLCLPLNASAPCRRKGGMSHDLSVCRYALNSWSSALQTTLEGEPHAPERRYGVYKAQGVHSRWCCGKRAFAFPSTPLLGQEEVA